MMVTMAHKIQPRLQRETKTLRVMIDIYCRGQHKSKQICPQCGALMAYAEIRVEKCPFSENKPTCAKCPAHCYKPEMRQSIKKVMRYSGPRMLHLHPVLTAFHLIDGLKKTPDFKRKS